MATKVYKRADTARSIQYQDDLLFAFDPLFKSSTPFIGLDDIPNMLRPTRRALKNDIVTASVALLADTERGAEVVVQQLNAAGCTLRCLEEDQVWITPIQRRRFIAAWKDARKRGSAKRGAEISAATKKAKTAAALAMIDHELKATDTPSKELLGRVGIRAIGTIKNHYGVPREELQRQYQAGLKRKARREKYREQRA